MSLDSRPPRLAVKPGRRKSATSIKVFAENHATVCCQLQRSMFIHVWTSMAQRVIQVLKLQSYHQLLNMDIFCVALWQNVISSLEFSPCLVSLWITTLFSLYRTWSCCDSQRGICCSVSCKHREDIAPPLQVRAIEQPDVLAWGGFGPPDNTKRPHSAQPMVCIWVFMWSLDIVYSSCGSYIGILLFICSARHRKGILFDRAKGMNVSTSDKMGMCTHIVMLHVCPPAPV